MKNPSLCIVVWQDHHTVSGNWMTRETAQKGAEMGGTVVSVGFLLRDDRKFVVLAQSWDRDADEFADCVAIHTAAVLRKWIARGKM